MAENFTNFAKTTLSSGISDSDTSISVTSGANFPTSDFTIVIGDASSREIVHIATRSGNTLTADQRGWQGSTAAAHSTGEAVVHTVLAHHITALGANGKGFVNHGSTAGTARPTGFASIEWYGSVQPTNAVAGDTWVDTT